MNQHFPRVWLHPDWLEDRGSGDVGGLKRGTGRENVSGVVRLEIVLARIFLASLPLFILVGPRIPFPGSSLGDLRVTDILIGVAVFFAMARSFSGGKRNALLLPFLWLCSALAGFVVFVGLLQGKFSVQHFYSLRLIELVLITLLVLGALRLAGFVGVRIYLFSTLLGGAINGVWILYQVLSADYGPLWNFTSRTERLYGAVLIGDVGPFPTGQVLLIFLAGAVALEVWSKLPRYWRVFQIATIVSSFLGLLSVGSRVSLASAIALAALWIVLLAKSAPGNLRALIVFLAPAILFAVALVVSMTPRSDVQTVQDDLLLRNRSFYAPLLAILREHFFLGVGPGGGRLALGWETHSTYLAILVDFGIIGFGLFLFAVLALSRICMLDFVGGREPFLRFLSAWVAISVLNMLVAGFLQDAHIPATSTHFLASILALYLFYRSGSVPLASDKTGGASWSQLSSDDVG